MTMQHRLSLLRGRQMVRWCIISIAIVGMMLSDASSSVAEAQQEKPPIRLRLLPLSVRNRSNGAILARMRLEYNQPKFIEGDLELVVYDGKQTTVPEDHIATLRYSDIVLPGQDYERIILLPPLRMGVQKTWSILATFTTKDGTRYPLSASATQFNPPMPHELLTTSPLDRCTLVCSCVAKSRTGMGSVLRRFLEQSLSLDNYNPISNVDVGVLRPSINGSDRSVELMGRQVVYHNQEIQAADLPENPLAYCAFDLVLMSDGGLGSLKAEQLSGMRKWIGAGGSVCIHPDGSLKSIHVDFLNALLGEDNPTDTRLSLADDGTLLVISDQPNAVLKARHGLGRVVILPADESRVMQLADSAQRAELGSIVGFLWKVRSDLGVHSGQLWQTERPDNILRSVRAMGIDAKADEEGVYVDLYNAQQLRRAQGLIGKRANGRGYINPGAFSGQNPSSGLGPRNEQILTAAQTVLLPADIQMVPTWIFILILTAYVLTIGPVDYFVLGWLRLRKLTWVLFPVVTLLYTFLTVAVAWAYMSSDDTGGRMTITDVGVKGVPLRQTTLETFYFGSSRVASQDLKNTLVVQGEQLFLGEDYPWMGENPMPVSPHAPLRYDGNSPQSFTMTQSVEQWSPLTLRSMSIEPENVNVPPLNWDDPALVSTPEGLTRLARQVRGWQGGAEGFRFGAAIWSSAGLRIIEVPAGEAIRINPVQAEPFRQHNQPIITNMSGLMGILPVAANSGTAATYQSSSVTMSPGFFKLVSQIAPNGCSALEDLNILDESDPRQIVLIILRQEGEDYHVFRKLYVLPDP